MMARITFKGNPIHTSGELPASGGALPAFALTKGDLGELQSSELAGKTVILNIFPSLDTSVCAKSVRQFNQDAGALPNSIVLCISHDLPFAMNRFCTAEGLKNVQVLSCFRHADFGTKFGVTIMEGPLKGLLARAVVVVNSQGNVVHSELVPEIAQEPDYSAALAAARR